MTNKLISSDNLRPFFWQEPLETLNQLEWEALCDGCAKCCLMKLEDEDDGEVYYTNLVCHYINLEKCACTDYINRHQNVENCIAFNFDDIEQMYWLPKTCAYRMRFLNKPLPKWHYLISGDKKTIHEAEETIAHFAEIFKDQDPEEHILIENL